MAGAPQKIDPGDFIVREVGWNLLEAESVVDRLPGVVVVSSRREDWQECRYFRPDQEEFVLVTHSEVVAVLNELAAELTRCEYGDLPAARVKMMARRRLPGEPLPQPGEQLARTVLAGMKMSNEVRCPVRWCLFADGRAYRVDLPEQIEVGDIGHIIYRSEYSESPEPFFGECVSTEPVTLKNGQGQTFRPGPSDIFIFVQKGVVVAFLQLMCDVGLSPRWAWCLTKPNGRPPISQGEAVVNPIERLWRDSGLSDEPDLNWPLIHWAVFGNAE